MRILALCILLSASSVAAQSTTCLTALQGEWRGPGVVLNRPIVMVQRFAPAMRGAFIEQTMRHLLTDTSTMAAFEGRAFYRVPRPTAQQPLDTAASISGRWFDARGVQFELVARCTEQGLASRWDGSTERGSTAYLVAGDTLTVIDSVYSANGASREFGRSRLVRVPR